MYNIYILEIGSFNMCYIYQQLSGKFADLASEYFLIRKTQGTEKAIEFFRSIQPELKISAPEDSNPENVWWIYNATDRITSAYDYSVIKNCKAGNDAVKALNAKYGGQWACYIEY